MKTLITENYYSYESSESILNIDINYVNTLNL